MSIELRRARRIVQTAADLLGDFTAVDDVAEIETRERVCAVLSCAAREIEDVGKTLYPV